MPCPIQHLLAWTVWDADAMVDDLRDQVAEWLSAHREVQDVKRELAADLWTDAGWIFAQPDGKRST